MYQTLYRKYRPNTFEKVKGQDVIVKTLKNAVLNNKISHAYLFEGPRGTGKTSIAKIFAKTINCENLIDGQPCNKCVSCTQINEGNPLDVIEMDAASSNSVEDIRDLINKSTVMPYNSKYKVYIIDEVHMLSQGAFNALLKTLEEPPKHIIFILATTDPQKLLSTIISRCQVFEFKKISIECIKENLEYISNLENIKITTEALYTISRLADGGMRDAISILDQVIAFKSDDIDASDVHKINGTLTQEELIYFINNIFKSDIEKIYLNLDDYEKRGINLIKLMDEIVVFLNNILITKYAPNYASKNGINIKIYEEFNNISKDLLTKYILSYEECINKMRQSSNPKLIMELELIKNASENNIQDKVVIEKKEDKKLENKVETKIEPVKNNDINYSLLENLKEIRTNNTLHYINKKDIIDMKNQIAKVKDFMLDSKFDKLPELILDGNIKAVGNNYLLMVYESEIDSKIFNENLIKIEELLKKSLEIEIKPIALSQLEYEPIKIKFNQKGKFDFIEEDILLNDIFKEIEIDPIKKAFGHLIKEGE